jgi:hypothetical protein
LLDAQKRSFAHGGGILALLQLLTSSNESLVLKAMEQLQNATYFGLSIFFLIIA